MDQGKQQLKFEINLINRFWDTCDMDSGRKMMLSWHSQAELKCNWLRCKFYFVLFSMFKSLMYGISYSIAYPKATK